MAAFIFSINLNLMEGHVQQGCFGLGGLAIWYRWISVAVTRGGHRDFLGGIRLASHR